MKNMNLHNIISLSSSLSRGEHSSFMFIEGRPCGPREYSGDMEV